MTIPFEPTGAFCYAFARDVAMPAIKARPDVASGLPFRLVEIAALVIGEHLTAEQQAVMVKRPKSEGEEPVRRLLKFYIERVAKEGGALVWLGSGMYRTHTAADISEEELDELDDAAIDDAAGDPSADAAAFDGHIYAFSFAEIMKVGEAFPIKIGMTTGSVEQRVASQCKSAATFSKPVILGSWPVKRVGAFEAAIHNILKVRGKWRDDAPGVEWFDTTLADVEVIVSMVAGA